MKLRKYLSLGVLGVFTTMILSGCGEVELAEYKGIEATKVICEISDDEVEAAIEEMMYDYITYDDVTDRAAIVGDNASITYVTTIDGEEDEDYSGEEEEIVIGEGYVFTDLENAIVGMKPGEKKKVSVKLTEDYVDEELVGKTASVDVTLNSLSVENTPEYTDEFVKENLGFDSKSEYEEQLKKDLLADKESEFKSEAVYEIVQTIIDKSKFKSYSQQLYKECEEAYNSNNEYMAAMYQMELEDYEELMGLDEDTKKEEIEAMVHEQQVINEIAKKENLTVSDEDIQTFAEENYEDYECETVEEFLEEYGKDDIKDYLLYNKVTDFLYDNATLTEITEEEYYSKMQEEYEDDESEDGEDSDGLLEDSDEVIIGDSDDTYESDDDAIEIEESVDDESDNEEAKDE